MARQFRWFLAGVFACTVSTGQAAPLFDSCAYHDAGLQQRGSEQKPQSGDQKPQSGDRRPGERGSETPRIKWWEDPKWRTELALTDHQSGKIKRIFEEEMGKLRALRDILEKRQAALSLAMKEERGNLAAITELADGVGDMHASMYRTRTLMLYRMDRQLSAEQRAKLQNIYERIQNERRQKEKEPDRHR
jgi:Spy/CpxP family protein refolding chaperone